MRVLALEMGSGESKEYYGVTWVGRLPESEQFIIVSGETPLIIPKGTRMFQIGTDKGDMYVVSDILEVDGDA